MSEGIAKLLDATRPRITVAEEKSAVNCGNLPQVNVAKEWRCVGVESPRSAASPLELSLERTPIDPEEPGGRGDATACLAKGPVNVVPLDSGKGRVWTAVAVP